MIKWSIKSFKPYKPPGGNVIFPALLQMRCWKIPTVLAKLLKATYLSHTLEMWVQTRAAFIPKVGNRPAAGSKSTRLVCLSLFVLKLMEN